MQTQIGALEPGSTLTLIAPSGEVNVYRPKIGDPDDRYTVGVNAHNGAMLAPLKARREGTGIAVTTPEGASSLLVRVPDRVQFIVRSTEGDVNVTDVTGNVRVIGGDGNVRVMVPGIAQASADRGNLNVTFGATTWPGTLRFSTNRGHIEVYVKQTAAFRVHLHTDDGTLFTDFGLRGTAKGNAETIDGVVNGGGHAAIDIETKKGAIRLLALTPQA